MSNLVINFRKTDEVTKNGMNKYILDLERTEYWISDSIDLSFTTDSFPEIYDTLMGIMCYEIKEDELPEDKRSITIDGVTFKCFTHKSGRKISVIIPPNGHFSDDTYELTGDEHDNLLNALLIYKWHCDFVNEKAVPNVLNMDVVMGLCFEMINSMSNQLEL